MPPTWSPSPSQLADKLLREWAAKEALKTGREVGDVLREVGILTKSRMELIKEKEIPLSIFSSKEND